MQNSEMSVERMLNDAVAAGMQRALREVKSKLRDACLLQQCYENPFGTVPGVDAKIDDIIGLLLPSIAEIERNKVYNRMASTLRGDNGKDL